MIHSRPQRSRNFTAACLLGSLMLAAPAAPATERRILVGDYVDKMKAGWISQMAGVGWGGPTEFKSKGRTIDENRLTSGPWAWKPQKINQFNQDDIYVEMTFLKTLEDHGFDVTIRQAGIDFANSGYKLWHANRQGRENLRSGIAPPDSGNPRFNRHSDDIDYQIEADYSGLIAPGMPNVVIALGEEFGRLMNYGDGVNGGQFIGGMYAEAFFEQDIRKIVEAGLACIPNKSQYAEMVRDMLAWRLRNPDDWKKTWELVEAKYHKDPTYTHGLCCTTTGTAREKPGFSIDVKLNGAYVLMGLLYGNGDPDRTIVIACACGQDSDCNPSNAAGVLFTSLGFSRLPERFTSALNPDGQFSHTPYTFPKLVEACRTLARKAVVRSGGRIEKAADGAEVMVIPVVRPSPGKPVAGYAPGDIANSRFTQEEMDRIVTGMSKAMNAFVPGWQIAHCGSDENPGLRETWSGRMKVLVTHPEDRKTPCVIWRRLEVPAESRTILEVDVAHDPRGDWEFVARADGRTLVKQAINKETCPGGWLPIRIDLTPFAGQSINVELLNSPNGWSYETGYWNNLRIVEE